MQFKKYFVKLIIFIILLLQWSNVSLAQSAENAKNIVFDCSDLNNQNEGPLESLIVVINEEPLGSNISDIGGSSIKRCARLTECTYTKSPDQNISDQWECITTFDEVKNCTGSEQRPKAEVGAKYKTCEVVQAYVASSGTDLLFTYIAQIYRYAALTGGIIAVFFLIIGGVMLAASGDNAEAVGQGKTIIMRSISGLILLFLSALILYTVNPNFFTI